MFFPLVMRAEIENGNSKIRNRGEHHSGRPAVLESRPRQYLVSLVSLVSWTVESVQLQTFFNFIANLCFP
jgi:hypothetical protein